MKNDNFDDLPLHTKFKRLFIEAMKKHGKQPCDIYHISKFEYSHINGHLDENKDCMFGTGDELLRSVKFKIIMEIFPEPDSQNSNTQV